MKTDTIYLNYTESLRRLKADNSLLESFKSDRNFTEILEHVDYDFGKQYETQIYKEFGAKHKDYVDLIYKNDSIGNPKTYTFDSIQMSPSNLRYIYHALLIQKKCSTWFKNKHKLKIIEIGGGYGGLCFYLENILKDYDIDYTIIDLPEPSYLQNLFLKKIGEHDVKTVSCFDVDSISMNTYDLVISNYCLSEIGVDNQKDYFNKLIKNCDKKFFIWNYLTVESSSVVWRYLKVRKLLAFFGIYPKISFINKNEYNFENERPGDNGMGRFIYSK